VDPVSYRTQLKAGSWVDEQNENDFLIACVFLFLKKTIFFVLFRNVMFLSGLSKEYFDVVY
jgi:hypothetical protein